ncbi:rhodanese-like domain-containing protein [Prescottella subtropica]|uniref:rhodanese-like domain-containing protein n=1 Tax=Prescottella subtropica TaxID=2545757 RepID=UPI0010F72E31|nr:rhodanese-like domain-containing protein [Prescottella subtropica]
MTTATFAASVDRLTVFEVGETVRRGAIFVDIRPQSVRVLEGTLPGALAIESDVLEQRVDPAGAGRLALAVDHDVEWVIVSSDGAASDAAVASLRRIGLHRTSGLAGGYRALKAAGLLGVLIGQRHCVRELAAVAAH